MSRPPPALPLVIVAAAAAATAVFFAAAGGSAHAVQAEFVAAARTFTVPDANAVRPPANATVPPPPYLPTLPVPPPAYPPAPFLGGGGGRGGGWINTCSGAGVSEQRMPGISVAVQDWYTRGSNVTISGAVRNVDPRFQHDVTVVVLGPAGNVIEIGQATPDGNGSYAASMIADGRNWDQSGGYTVRARHSAGTACAPFVFFSGDGAPPAALAHPVQAVDISGGAANLTIGVARLAGPGAPPLDGSASSTVTFPPSETSVVAPFATVTFPPGVTAAHVPSGGRLALHVAADVPDAARVQDVLAYEGSGRVALQRVVEVGGGSARVTFDMPVRILLEGQAGGRAFYIEGGADGGTITPIDAACAADDTARVHRHLGGAGECQMDSPGGDKIIHTYHLTRFGTALPERSVPPPAVHTCSVGLGAPDLGMSARPGGRSEPAQQTVINSGSAPFARVDLAASAWRAGPSQGADAPASLPASATGVGTAGPGGPYRALANGTAVAAGLGGGQEAPLWFRLDLAPYGDARVGTLVQEVSYQATCRLP